jgi:ankyrin repeat protein
VQLLIEKGADVNAASKDEWTALLLAASGGHVDVVKMLLAHQADLKARNRLGETALEVAELRGHREVARLLREEAERRRTIRP